MEIQQKPVPGYLPTLDGWRAIAIAMVLLNHDKVHSAFGHSLNWLHENGNRGVSLFFALSGVLICSRLLQEERLRGRLDLRGFYIRRICRIQPAALTYLAVISLLMLVHILQSTPREVLSSALLVRNYLPLHSLQNPWYTAHYWSLSVEEHFYLLLPGFLVLVHKRRARILVVVLMALEVWRHFVFKYPSLRFGDEISSHTDIAIDGILMGALVAILLTKPSVRQWCVRWLHPWITCIVTIAIWIFLEFFPLVPLANALLLITFPLLIVSTMLHPDTISGKLLENPVLRFIGRISYSLYLWQMLFFVYNKPVPPPHSALLRRLEGAPWRYLALFAVSVLSYYLIEKPLMRLGHKLAKPATRGRGDLEDPADSPSAPTQNLPRKDHVSVVSS